MPFPIRVDRDCHVVNWIADLPGWCTTLNDPATDSWAVRSDGVLVTEYGTVVCNDNTGVISAGLGSACGIHISGPDSDTEFTLYSLQVDAIAEDEFLRPCLFIAESPASISNDAAGNTVTDVRILAVPDGSGVAGGCLSAEMVVAVKQNTAGRNLCFMVALLAGTTDSTSAHYGVAHLTVRRLIGNKPLILDPTKLG